MARSRAARASVRVITAEVRSRSPSRQRPEARRDMIASTTPPPTTMVVPLTHPSRRLEYQPAGLGSPSQMTKGKDPRIASIAAATRAKVGAPGRAESGRPGEALTSGRWARVFPKALRELALHPPAAAVGGAGKG